MARPYPSITQDETPTALFDGATAQIQCLFVFNASETAGAWIKLYNSETAPTSASRPAWQHWVAPGASGSGGNSVVLPPFVGGGQWWLAAAANADADLTAPDEALVVSITYE